MSATNDLFTRWKAHKRIDTDSEAAKRLGVSHGTPHHWKQGRNASVAVLERMAKDLGEDVIPHYLAAMAEAAKDAEDKRTLARLARRLGAACFALLALAPLMLHSSPAEAAGGLQGNDQLIHYAKWLTARFRRIKAGCRLLFARMANSCNPHALHPARP